MTSAPAAVRHRAKVSVSVDPLLLQAVDSFVEAHPETDRSRVVDEALSLWYARQQEQAMVAQFSAPVSAVEAAEQADWGHIQRRSAGRIFGPRRDAS